MRVGGETYLFPGKGTSQQTSQSNECLESIQCNQNINTPQKRFNILLQMSSCPGNQDTFIVRL